MEDGFSFSTPLKLRLVAYFRDNYDLDIKDEEADLFLTSLAALYGALAEASRTSTPEDGTRYNGDDSGEAGAARLPTR
jgi:hypothetical protein